MLDISDRAKALLKDLLPQRTEPDQVFRLSRQGTGFSLRFEPPREGDLLFEEDGEQILAVAPDLADGLNATIDREDSPEGPRLVLVR